jgi:uncharacterized membrane protein YfcA
MLLNPLEADAMTFQLPSYPMEFWPAAVVAVLLVGVSKGGFGSGIGVAATPIIALTISAADAAALLLPLLIVADTFAVRQYYQRFDKSNLIQLTIGALIGIAVGWFYFGYFSHNERILKLGIGLLALAFVIFQLGRTILMGALVKRKPRKSEGVFWGMLAGFVSTLAHVGSPPVLIHLLPQKLARDIYVGTMVLFFMIMNVVKLAPYAQLGLLRIGNLAAILLLSPLAYAGVKLGVMLNRRFSDLWFNRVIYCALALTAVQLIAGRSIVHLFF